MNNKKRVYVNMTPLLYLSFAVFSRSQLRQARVRFHLKGLVDIHHVIPQSCKGHPALARCRFKVHDDANLMFMPNKKGSAFLRLRPNRLVHVGSHMKYNHYVWSELDRVESHTDLTRLLLALHTELRASNATIPWN